MRTDLLATTLLSACVLGHNTHAAHIIEVNNGLDIFPDQPGDPFNFIGDNDGTFTLDLGLNIAEGFFTCFGFGCTDDFDSFRMIVPDGLRVVSTTLSVDNTDGTAEQLDVYPVGVFTEPERFSEDWRTSYRPLELRLVTFLSRGPQTSNTVLEAGAYDVVPFNFAWIGSGGWRAEFVTQVVPEPSSALLLGLCMSAFVRRRRK